MPDTRDVVKRVVEDCLKADGWKKVAGEWKKRNGDLLLLVGLQRSSYGPKYFLNLGVAFGSDEGRKVVDSEINYRADRLDIDNRFDVSNLLNLDGWIEGRDREQEVTKLMNELVLPLLNRATSIDSLSRGGAARELVERAPLLSLRAKFLE